ncbi:MAG: hypothetical protein ACKVU1_04415 [bacterium]
MTEEPFIIKSWNALELIHAKLKPPWVEVKTCRFDRERLVINVDQRYEADIERCTNSAKLLDMIFQVTSKSWCTPEITHDFLLTIARACHEVHGAWVQGVYCPHGRSRRVSWKPKNRRPAAPENGAR